jgi:hypothetical protein
MLPCRGRRNPVLLSRSGGVVLVVGRWQIPFVLVEIEAWAGGVPVFGLSQALLPSSRFRFYSSIFVELSMCHVSKICSAMAF